MLKKCVRNHSLKQRNACITQTTYKIYSAKFLTAECTTLLNITKFQIMLSTFLDLVFREYPVLFRHMEFEKISPLGTSVIYLFIFMRGNRVVVTIILHQSNKFVIFQYVVGIYEQKTNNVREKCTRKTTNTHYEIVSHYSSLQQLNETVASPVFDETEPPLILTRKSQQFG